MIYVDDLKKCRPVDETGGRWRFQHYCHLFADSHKELHDFAIIKLGLKLEYFQNLKHFPHYDLTKTKRRLAVANGAVEISTRDMVDRARALLAVTVENH
jgi:hypothetical protein